MTGWGVMAGVIAGAVVAVSAALPTKGPELPASLTQSSGRSAAYNDDSGLLALISAQTSYRQAYLATIQPLLFNRVIYDQTGHMPRPPTALFLRLYQGTIAGRASYEEALSKVNVSSKPLLRTARRLAPWKELDLEGPITVMLDLRHGVTEDRYLRDVLSLTGNQPEEALTRRAAITATARGQTTHHR